MIESMAKTVPFLLKLLALVFGGAIALALSGDINLDKDNTVKLTLNTKLMLKMVFSIYTGWSVGEFVVDWCDFEQLTPLAQNTIFMLCSIFSMLLIGIVYRSVQMTFTDKTLSEIVDEIKQVARAILK